MVSATGLMGAGNSLQAACGLLPPEAANVQQWGWHARPRRALGSYCLTTPRRHGTASLRRDGRAAADHTDAVSPTRADKDMIRGVAGSPWWIVVGAAIATRWTDRTSQTLTNSANRQEREMCSEALVQRAWHSPGPSEKPSRCEMHTETVRPKVVLLGEACDICVPPAMSLSAFVYSRHDTKRGGGCG